MDRRTCSAALAQDAFPSKPLRIVCPFAPGCGFDFIAHVASHILSQRLGQSTGVDKLKFDPVADLTPVIQLSKGAYVLRVRPLAVTTAERFAACPDMPAIAEAGVPGYDVVAWHRLIAPKNLSPAGDPGQGERRARRRPEGAGPRRQARPHGRVAGRRFARTVRHADPCRDSPVRQGRARQRHQGRAVLRRLPALSE